MAKKGSKPEIKKKDILELLRQGHTIQQALSVRKIPTSTFYSWRRKDDHYDGLVEIARTEGEKVKAAREEISASYVPMKDWQREFLHYYVRTGGVMQETCNLAGVELQDVLNYLDPRSQHFDKIFSVQLDKLNPVITQQVEDVVLKKIRQGGSNADSTAKWWLERRLPERYGRTQTVEHEHRVQFSKEGDAEAMKVLAKILGDDDVVDAEVVALEAEQPRQLQGDSEAEGDAALVGVDASVASTGQA